MTGGVIDSTRCLPFFLFLRHVSSMSNLEFKDLEIGNSLSFFFIDGRCYMYTHLSSIIFIVLNGLRDFLLQATSLKMTRHQKRKIDETHVEVWILSSFHFFFTGLFTFSSNKDDPGNYLWGQIGKMWYVLWGIDGVTMIHAP